MLNSTRNITRRNIGAFPSAQRRLLKQVTPSLVRFNTTFAIKNDKDNKDTTTTEIKIESEIEETKVNVSEPSSSSASSKPWYLRNEFSGEDLSESVQKETESITYPETFSETKDHEFVEETCKYLHSKLGLNDIIVFDMVNGERVRSFTGEDDIIIVASAKSGRHCIGSIETLKKYLKHDCNIDGGGIHIEGIVSSTSRKKETRRLQRRGGQVKKATEWFNKDSGDWIVLEFQSKNGCNILINVLEERKRGFLNLEELYCRKDELEKYQERNLGLTESYEEDFLAEGNFSRETNGASATNINRFDADEDNILVGLRRQLARNAAQVDQKRSYSTSTSGIKFQGEKEQIEELNRKWNALSHDHSPNSREWELRLLELQHIMENSNNLHFYEVICKQYLDLKLLFGQRMVLSELLKLNVLCISHIYKVTEALKNKEEIRYKVMDKMMVKLLNYFDFVKSIQDMSIEKFLLLSLKQVSGTSKFYSVCQLIQLQYPEIPLELKTQILKEAIKHNDVRFVKRFWLKDSHRYNELLKSWITLVEILESETYPVSSNSTDKHSISHDFKKLIKQDLLGLLQRDLMILKAEKNETELYSRLNDLSL